MMASQHNACVKVFLVDDSEPIRSRIAGMLGEMEGISVIGEAATAAGTAERILQSAPDAVLLDLQLLDGTGMDVLNAVHPQAPGIVFIVLTNHSGNQYRNLCMASGATHFLDKSLDFKKICQILGEIRVLSSNRQTDQIH